MTEKLESLKNAEDKIKQLSAISEKDKEKLQKKGKKILSLALLLKGLKDFFEDEAKGVRALAEVEETKMKQEENKQ